MSENLRILALDFDGVVWDSAGECYQVGWRAYQELTGRVLSDRVFERGFLRGRPLARTGHDFYLLLRLMEEDPNRDLAQMTLEEFVHYRGLHAEQAAKFDRVFYLLRAHYRDSDPALWASWQQPYHDFVRELDEWESRFDGVALATTKDTDSARDLMATVGRRWPVFGKEFSEHKADQIAGIAQHFKAKPEQILFLDDLLENLDQVRPTGARMALADWGYNLLEARGEAATRGYRVVGLDSVGTLFAEFLS